MRINVGIRRRLAPLVENDLRRVQLLTSLLFSFPGTPIIYYGDEIGMGDNIYLGDRNGVRTPMQWSPDRNGGFSRSNPARLYSPLILDPVYGYEAVNVEAQHGDPSSLLNWMRNMIALRKLFKVFGRGSMEFLRPANRKVLAYLRRYEGDNILCVANLSRFAQPVELDLSTLAGMVPVEMLGYTEFPAIGRNPYPLTVGPYGFYWFELQGVPTPLEIRSGEEAVEEVISLSAQGSWESLMEGERRLVLESKFLPEFLGRQRWFGAKARKIEAIRLRDWVELAPGSVLTVLDVESAGGSSETYSVPLAMAFGAEGESVRNERPDAVVCRLNRENEVGVLYDAMASDAACKALVCMIGQTRELRTHIGTLRGVPTVAYSGLSVGGDSLPVTRVSGEQSNTSVVFGEQLILKLFRRMHAGPNPDFEIGKYLTERGTFPRVPRLAGGIEYERNASSGTFAMLQAVVPNRGDGWTVTSEELGRYYERCAAAHEPPPREAAGSPYLCPGGRGEVPEVAPPALVQQGIGMYLAAASTLGTRTAELHLALAGASDEPARAR
jgi:maltose alpha-D-glucosyltransferase/alpha-amylase